MKKRYEYKFVRIGQGFFGVKKWARDDYPDVIHEYGREGWRFVQIFAPGTGPYGMVKYYELIFEREINPEDER